MLRKYGKIYQESTKFKVDNIEHLHKTVELVLDIIKEMSPGTDVEMYQQLKELICVDVLKAIQFLGFNYKEAIGEPLTQICANAILSKSRKTGQSKRKQV